MDFYFKFKSSVLDIVNHKMTIFCYLHKYRNDTHTYNYINFTLLQTAKNHYIRRVYRITKENICGGGNSLHLYTCSPTITNSK